MADTIRTEADLLANSFQDGQANNSISAQDMRDLIVSTKTINPELVVGSANPAHQEGKVFYDSVAKALSYYNENTEVTVNIGQETLVRCINNTGGPLADGDVVYISGVDTGLPEVTKAIASSATPEIIGVVTSNMLNGATGYVTLSGLVHGIDVSTFAPGDIIYLDSGVAGTFTATAPTLPIETIIVGTIVDNVVDGQVLVSPQRINYSRETTVTGHFHSDLDQTTSLTDTAVLVMLEVELIKENVSHAVFLTSDAATLTFANANPDTITRTGGSSDFITEGFLAGMEIVITGSTSNDDRYTIAAGGVAATVLTLEAGDALANEGPVAATIEGNPGDTGEITIEVDGVYQIDLGIQIYQAGGGGGAYITAWFQEDTGSGWVDTTAAIARTASSNAAGFANLAHTERYVVGDKIRPVWATDNTNGEFRSIAASPPTPHIPSVTITIRKIGTI